MYRIGIIGSDNSHAEIFSKLVNLPDEKTGAYRFPDLKVNIIFGLEEEQTRQVAEAGRIETIAKSPEEFFGKVDAVMVVFRHGDLHLPYAMPFVKAGIPTWIDKPFTIKTEDAAALIREAEQRGALLTGGSTCRYIHDLTALKNSIQNGSRIGKIRAAVMNFPATLENEYGGIYFYGAHLAEMAMEAFGYDAVSVVASENKGLVTAIVKYDEYQLTLNFIPGCKEYFAILYGENGTAFRELDITGCYIHGFVKFVEMLRSKSLPVPFKHFYAPVELLNAIRESYETGDEIYLTGVVNS